MHGQEPVHDPLTDTTRMVGLSEREAELAELLGHELRWLGDQCVARLTLAELRQINHIMEWSEQ